MRKLISMFIAITATTTTLAREISGKVVGANNEPLDFVNVILLKADSTYVTGAVTDENGIFIFGNTSDDTKYIRITSIGYTEKTIDIPLSDNSWLITLDPTAEILNEVVVKSNRPVTAIKGDALVTTVAGSQLELAGTANDVLSQVPMVLGRDGNFEVFGKGSPAIYINGRKVMDLTQLSQLSSSDIKNIEVISNPGAKYDASVKSVIRIHTKRPQGDGFSCNIRAQGVMQKYFRTINQTNFKFRTGGLELFGNFGYFGGNFRSSNRADMLTISSILWEQSLNQVGHMTTNEFYGKMGLSYLFNENHSLGAYYSNGFTKQKSEHSGVSTVFTDGVFYDNLTMFGITKSNTLPKHHANFYYNGEIGNLGIDFNMDYMWRKSNNNRSNDESSDNMENSIINSWGINQSRMFAERLVLSYPFCRGGIEFGEEYTVSRFSSDYVTDASVLCNANSKVDENNIAEFLR